MDGRSMVGLSHRAEWVVAFVLLALAAILYLWTATSAANPLTSKLQPDDLYNRLSDGFLAGQLSFRELPNPKLAELDDPWDPAQNAGLSPFHDVTYYKGRYYLYFGPAPAVLLLAPWKALTGTYLGENVAAAIFAILGAAASMAIVVVIKRRHFPATKTWVVGFCMGAAAFANFALPMLRRPVAYELAIASAYAFAMASALCIALALQGGPSRRRWLALASAAYGLTLASRPNYLFGAVLLCAPLVPAWLAWRSSKTLDREALGRDLRALIAPLAAIVLLLLAYNAKRFGSPLEFGTYYMLAGLHPQHQALVSFGFLPTNVWFYFLAPAQLSAFFPFFQVIHMPQFTMPTGYIGEEDMYGIIPNMPFLWMAFLVRPILRPAGGPSRSELRHFLWALLALAAVNLLFVLRLNGASNRYFLDILPSLLLVACVGVFWSEQVLAKSPWKLGARIGWVGALIFTVLFNFFVSLEHNELLRFYNPSAYGGLAHAFNHISTWSGETGPAKTGPLHLRLKFPADRLGKAEPLVVTGVSFRADFIYLIYTNSDHIQIGFEHTSYGGTYTKSPVKIDYAVEHTLDIEMGSLYPPVEHPYYDGMAPTTVTKLKRKLRITLDGTEILAGNYDFYDSSPGDISVGRNPVSDAFGKKFTGQVLEVARQPRPQGK